MIVYESNKNWLKDVRHLYRSWTMQRVLRSTLIVAAGTGLLCIADMHLFHFVGEGMDTGIFSLLGIVLSILLAFRTTTAYDRWWEGRKMWGQLVNDSRNLAIYLQSTMPSEDRSNRHFFATRIANFGIALKEHLREGVKVDELVYLSEEEKEVYSSKGHIPAYISGEIIQRIQDAFKAGAISPEDHLNIKLHSQEFMNICGACERIKKTPIPFSYNVYLKVFISLYAALLPFALLPMFGYWTILMVSFVFFAFIGIELMAEEVEDPFGLDCNDLPTGEIAHTIKNNVFEILEQKSSLGKEHTTKLYDKIF